MQRTFMARFWPALLVSLCLAAPASAHPHVWVTARADVVVENGAVSAVQHAWTFDEFYTAMAIEGLDTNKDGHYDRKELAELAQVNMDGLKEFAYFTYATSKNAKLAFDPPQDHWLEHTNGLLILHFTLPLTQPLPVQGANLTVSIYDPSYFIAFEFAKDDPVRAVGAPAGCKAALKPDDTSEDEQNLSQAFSAQMSTASMAPPASNSFEVACAK